jgi:hypothetical protein
MKQRLPSRIEWPLADAEPASECPADGSGE